MRAKDAGSVAEFMQKPSWLNLVAIVTAGGGEGGAAQRGSSSSSFGEFGTAGGAARPGMGAQSGGGNYESEATQLASMGFDKKKAKDILSIVNGNMELAIEMLSTG